MRSSLPNWIGWPGSGPAPGHDWLPGPILRFCILGLAYGFLALSLTVNYAASVPFFLLAIIGMYVGLRRGFLNGLTRPEKWAMRIFAAYPIVAIVSYLAGVQTNVGFRFLGRDLRFLLFIPVFLAIRWSRPHAKHVGWALAVAAVYAFMIALIQDRPWPAPVPHGVAGTHITFGDLALLSGFMAAAILWPGEADPLRRKLIELIASVLAVAVSIAASVVAGARGGWIAIPILGGMLISENLFRGRGGWRLRSALAVGLIVASGLSVWLVPSVNHRVTMAYKNLIAYKVVANAQEINTPCVDSQDFLNVLVAKSKFRGPGVIKIVRLEKSQRASLPAYGCSGSYAIEVTVPTYSRKPAYLALYRGNWPAGASKQRATLLARGNASFNLGWKAPWTQISDSKQWRRYGIAKAFPKTDRTHGAHIKVRPGYSVLLIPMQERRGAFAFPLVKTSVGHRLEMWRAALALFLKNPWLGSGTGSFHATGEAALGDSAAAPVVGGYEHAHSDYLTSLGTKGVLGFLVLLALLLTPRLLDSRLNGGKRVRVMKVPTLMLVCGFGAFALTETMLIHSLVISWFVINSALLVALSRQAVKSKELM